jgi:cysteine desulfurase family protein (TIGR01976 family)
MMEGLLPEKWVDESAAMCDSLFDDCMSRVGDMEIGMDGGYAEIVQRAKGRYDMTYGMDELAHIHTAKKLWEPIIKEILVDDYHQLFTGLLMTEPGASEQLWHADGSHLFPDSQIYNPAHCVNVFVPLCDITTTNGPTEFCLGTQRATNSVDQDGIVWQDEGHKDAIGFSDEPTLLTYERGTALIFDYRVLHRGLNHAGLERRPMLYFTYARTWFSDNLNFPKTPMASLSGAWPVLSAQSDAINVDAARAQFPALSTAATNPHAGAIFCDGAAGTQVPTRVVDAMNHNLFYANANLGGGYKTGEDTLTMVEHARRTFGAFLNCDPEEVIFGTNATTLGFHVANTLAKKSEEGQEGWVIGPEDNIVVTMLDHETNVGPWHELARRTGAEIRYIDLRTESCSLDLDRLASGGVIDGNTRLVACGAAANSCGTVNDIHKVVALCREVQSATSSRCLTYIDAVHFAPHRLIDVQEIDCDFLVCSSYKFFGPHGASLLYGRRDIIDGAGSDRNTAATLVPDKLRPTGDELPMLSNWHVSRWELGTQNYEAVAGAIAAVEYIADLCPDQDRVEGTGDYDHLRQRLERSWAAVELHEHALTRRFLAGASDGSIPGLKVFGDAPNTPRDGASKASKTARTCTFAVEMDGMEPEDLAAKLVEHKIYCSSGNFYALGVSTELGLEPRGGWVRLAFMHYNTANEVDRVLDALRTVSAARSP